MQSSLASEPRQRADFPPFRIFVFIPSEALLARPCNEFKDEDEYEEKDEDFWGCDSELQRDPSTDEVRIAATCLAHRRACEEV